MIDRPSKVASLYAAGAWTYAEIGIGRGKKIYKQIIKRKRRTLEKRDASNEIGREVNP